ncbi:hypothetical protein [Bdellovibrio bacteriovorus]|uniref:hypothetical protein n=1 Tax=Bdellovibrio bacteriovorus TaxID=959 RepID=UPI0035A6DB78
MLFIVKNIFLLAENEDFPRSLSKLPKEWQNESDDLKKRLNYNGDIHFIIGPWGSGKSTFISTLLSNNDYFRRPQRISLSTATTQDEIFSFLIRPGVKFLYVVIALLSIYISSRYFTLADFYQEVVSNNPTIASIVALFVALFITNRFRLFYIVSSYLEPLLGKQIKIIEDYDREI